MLSAIKLHWPVPATTRLQGELPCCCQNPKPRKSRHLLPVGLALLWAQVVAVGIPWVEREAHALHLLLPLQQLLLPLCREAPCFLAVPQHLLPNRRSKTSLYQAAPPAAAEAHNSIADVSISVSTDWCCEKYQESSTAGWHLWQQHISKTQASSTACGSPHEHSLAQLKP